MLCLASIFPHPCFHSSSNIPPSRTLLIQHSLQIVGVPVQRLTEHLPSVQCFLCHSSSFPSCCSFSLHCPACFHLMWTLDFSVSLYFFMARNEGNASSEYQVGSKSWTLLKSNRFELRSRVYCYQLYEKRELGLWRKKNNCQIQSKRRKLFSFIRCLCK